MSDFLQVCEDANGVYDDSGSIEGYMFKKGGTHKACATNNLTCLTKYTRSAVLHNTEGW